MTQMETTPASNGLARPPLPIEIQISESFANRLLPTQRLIDQLTKLEPDADFGVLAKSQPFRIIAFRWLMREYPDDDPARLWMHAYDVEIELIPLDPTNGASPTIALPSFASGT